MAQLIVRNLEEDVKTRLRQRASRDGRSVEEEVRNILLRDATKREGKRCSVMLKQPYNHEPSSPYENGDAYS